jgi:hypothetical protein
LLLGAAALAVASVSAEAAEPPRQASLRGTLEILQEDDFAQGLTRQLHAVVDASTGRRFHLRFAGNPPSRLRHGSSVLVRGQVLGDRVVVGLGAGDGIELLAEAEPPSPGARRVVVLVVDFVDSVVSCSDTQIAGLMFEDAESVDGLYRAASHGQLALPADTDRDGRPDVLRVGIEASGAGSCDPYGWAEAAEARAMAAGVDLGLYEHRLFVLPATVGCPWAGLGNVACGAPCRAWVKTCELPDVYAHEIGHNLGMAHAATDLDNDGQADCEYCDDSDFMGYGGLGWRLLNGPHEQQMGWLPGGQIVDVPADGPSTHLISPLHEDPLVAPHPQVLRILKRDRGDYYYVTYRRREGYDGALGPAHAERANIHRYPGAGYSRTLFVGALGDGETFEDPANALVLTQLAHDGSSATVRIEAGCAPAPPVVAVLPSVQAGRPGQERSYSVAVTNADAQSCDPVVFMLSAELPEGWGGGLSPVLLSLGPGARGEATLTAAPPAGAPDGSHVLTLRVEDPGEPRREARVAASYLVDGKPPAAVSDLTGSSWKGRVQLAWTASVDGGSGVAAYRVHRDGVLIGSTEATRYVDSQVATGRTYTYYVTAVDAVGNESSPGNIVRIHVTPPATGKPGRATGRPAPRRYLR